jgi:hypothetical protein
MLETDGMRCWPLSPGREATASGPLTRGSVRMQPQVSPPTGAGGTGASGGREPREHIGPEQGLCPPAGDEGGWCTSCGIRGRDALGAVGAAAAGFAPRTMT